MTNDFQSIQSADVILVIGSNTTEAHPVVGAMIKERTSAGAKLIVCDPRRIELAGQADFYVRQRSGSDTALINSMMHVIIEEELFDADFIEERTENFAELRDVVKNYSPERAWEITGVEPEIIRQIASVYAKGSNSAIFYTMGITQHTTGTDNVRSLCGLALLCGMFGRSGTGVNPLRGQNNVQGSCDMGALADTLPGYMKVTHPDAAEKVKRLWNCELNPKPGKSVAPMIEAAGRGELRALYIMGENPMVTDANTAHVAHSLDSLDFLVVEDIFLTETAQKADVVLPAACWAEKEGTFTNTCRAVQRVRKAVEAPGEAKADWEIIMAVANEMGAGWTFASPAEIFDDMTKFVASYAGMSHARLEEKPLQWPCPEAGHGGTPLLHVGKFSRAGGKAKFIPVEWKAPHEWPDEEYPFIATTGRSLYHYHSGAMTRRSAPGEFITALYIEINPSDAEKANVTDETLIRIISRRGSVEGAARVTETVPPGVVFLPFHFAEAAANNLTANVWDKTSETPPFKISAVKVVKIASPRAEEL